ncbi:response regulator [Parafilimonas terrae]|uniref:Response regulator receiver domain-containing protein n=1 Tax=Parafilimonas terrae TaxID=1465490 RepID=A0A1I5YU87_9BACT|nr:response regulator [Parafilimonas terrae]SFQ47821.1 Response regulator receiver domain-containing protein [Parafilimonas terrae]
MKKVLIIDDDLRNTFALSAVLKARGYAVAVANNMVEAFAMLEKQVNEIGIILLDMMMPGMDGYDAIPVLKSTEAYKNIPVVAVTAQAMAGDREKCLNAGASDYIPKPVDVDWLVKILNESIK